MGAVILLWGVPGDGPLDAVQAALLQQGAAFCLLDQRQAAQQRVRLRVAAGGLQFHLSGASSGLSLDSRTVGAAYVRPVDTLQALPAAWAARRAARQRAEAVDRALLAWADLGTALVLNPPAAMAVNNAKPYQLQQIAGYGFAVPATLVGTDPDAVRAFAACHGAIIYKSISGTRSIVKVLGEEGWAHIGDVAHAPTQFQAYVPGHDVRVHVVGEQIFATEVRSAADDYRYASLSGQSVELASCDLPSDVAQRCIAMARGMGLALAGIDLRHTPDGRWVCFEVNPSPAFVYYEAATGQPIAQAIARLLATADAAVQRNVQALRARTTGRTGPRRRLSPPPPNAAPAHGSAAAPPSPEGPAYA